MLLMAAILVACGPARQMDGPVAVDPFADFRRAVAKYFTPVAGHFSLRTVAERQVSHDMFIEYRGPAAKLTVAHEVGSGSWVYVTVTTAGGHERQFGLHTIVVAQTGSTDSFQELNKLHDPDAQVRALADLTLKHAGALLEERTANLRELHQLREKAVRERERTELGYDRTRDPRPALAELLQACEPAHRVVCAYAAVVDYSYSPEDVAAFLKIAPGDVQRMIAQHDTLR